MVLICRWRWLSQLRVKSIRYRPSWNKVLYGIFVAHFLVLATWHGPPSAIGTLVSQVGTMFYLAFFLLMPWWSRIGELRPCPTA